MPGAIEGVRVLDLTDRRGHMCGRLLADLGADVVKVEGPAGDPARRTPPFAGDRPGPERSLDFLNLNANKRSIVLDLESAEGKESFLGLVRNADAVLETYPPGVMEKMGLGRQVLTLHNPGLVVASITGFGLSGPHSGFKAPPIVCSAMGGVMALCGSPDREPLSEPGDVPYDLAASFAAYGVLLALRQRDRGGRGQRVEVSCQEVLAAQQHVIVNYSSNSTFLERAGSRTPLGGGMPYGIYPASDGYCHLVVIATPHWRSFVEWMGSPEVLTDPLWDNRHIRIASQELIESLAVEFTRQIPKDQLFSQGQAHHITVGPVNRPDEFTRDAHFLEREMLEDVRHPVVGDHKLVRPPFRLSETPAQVFRPAPELGRHTEDVKKTWNTRPPPDAQVEPGTAPLEGIRVLDFTQAIAGPYLARLLTENGAEVIKVESRSHQQRGRASSNLDPRVVLQQRVTFNEMNRDKRCVTVDMGTEEGRRIVKDLVPHCDLVLENFSPRVMDRWGMGYEDLRKLRGDVIMVRLPGFGVSGPYRDYVGLAAVAMGITGMYHLWSYPDREEPEGPPVWTPDYLSAAFGGVAIMAALHHRDRTGRGQLVELSQVDATAFALGAVYLDYLTNGHVAAPMGNGHRTFAPHGAFRCKGEDAWCVIAVRDEGEWQALCRALGSPPWSADDRFATMDGRLENWDELAEHIQEWTRDHTPHQAMRLLQKAGVPAGAVQDGEHLFHDPHLRERGFIVGVEEDDVGVVEYPGLFVRLSDTPGRIERCHRLGEDNAHVFNTLLGMSEEEIERLEESGILA